MASLNVKLALPSPGNSSPKDILVTDARKSDYRDAVSISAFGNEEDARAFLKSSRSDLEELGFSSESEIRPLHSKKSGEVIGCFLRKRPEMTDSEASSAISAVASGS